MKEPDIVYREGPLDGRVDPGPGSVFRNASGGHLPTRRGDAYGRARNAGKACPGYYSRQHVQGGVEYCWRPPADPILE